MGTSDDFDPDRINPNDICDYEVSGSGPGWNVTLYTPSGEQRDIACGLPQMAARDLAKAVSETVLAWVRG